MARGAADAGDVGPGETDVGTGDEDVDFDATISGESFKLVFSFVSLLVSMNPRISSSVFLFILSTCLLCSFKQSFRNDRSF